MIKELAEYLEDETALEIGVDLFPGFAPNGKDEAVILIESGGVPNFYLTDKQTKALQVVSRSINYWTARQNAFSIYEVLHGMSGVDLPIVDAAYTIETAEASMVPQSLGQDEKGLFNISTNYLIRFQNKQ